MLKTNQHWWGEHKYTQMREYIAIYIYLQSIAHQSRDEHQRADSLKTHFENCIFLSDVNGKGYNTIPAMD